MLNVVTCNLTNTIGVNMKSLEKKIILGADDKTMVYVYDGDVDYRPTKDSVNYRYYWNENGKRCKTRPYVQYSAMTNRCKKDGKHKEVFQCYEKSYLGESFKSFDDWCNWANNQVGYMCEDDSGNLYQQDKDLLGNGDGLYSENTCCFIEPKLNSLFKMLDSDVKGVRVTASGSYQVVYNGGKTVPVVTRGEALYLAHERDKQKLKDYIDNFANSLDEKVLLKLLEKYKKLDQRSFELHEVKVVQAQQAEVIHKFKVDFASITDEKKSKCRDYPKNIIKKGKKFCVQMTFKGKSIIENGKYRKLFDKLKDAEIYQAQKQLELFDLLEKEYLCNDFIPKNIVDEFYSSKNFYERKLEMLLSNMF